MERKEYPAIEVETKYGPVTMTFLSPRLEMKEWHESGVGYVRKPGGPLARIAGKITINRIPLDVQFGVSYHKVSWHKGRELDVPVIEFNTDNGAAYNRREDRSAWDYSAGYAEKLRELPNTVLRAAYEAHPELAADAERVYLHNVAADAYAKVQEAKEELRKAEKVYADACVAAAGL
jgi:hypothetical protein